jgi:cell wall-associated NlpC family hydrolase
MPAHRLPGSVILDRTFMDLNNLEDLKYPIGKYQAPDDIGDSQRKDWLAAISDLPSELTEVVRGLREDQLDTPYRDGGWDGKASGASCGRQPYE